MNLPHSITLSGATPPEKGSEEARWLVVINHHEARIFHSGLRDTVALQIRPRQSDDSISHVHSFDGFSRGQEKPLASTFFGPVADALKDASQILIFGSGTGMANEMEQLIEWIKMHHPELAQRIVGSEIVDEHHQTDAQLLEKARAFFGPSDSRP